MVRIASFVLAVVLGTCAVLLVTSNPDVRVAGETVSCPGIIVSGETSPKPHGAVADACADKRRDWAVLAGLAVLACAACGAIFHLRGADAPSREAALT
ncbi:hypothetical protein GCM10009795_008630 [Nocardioides hankookensis]